MKLNIALLKKVRNRIKLIPKAYDQNAWLRETDDSPCGTKACIAGETIICAAPSLKVGLQRLRDANRRDRVAERAAKLLGMQTPDFGSYNDTARLFSGSPDERWPEPFGSQYDNAVTDRGRAGAAVRYLDWIIANKKLG